MKTSMKEKFYQMIMIGLDIDNINEEITSLIRDYKIGGIVLYKNLYNDIDSMIEVINKLKRVNVNNTPLFIALDQENGIVNRFPSDIERIYNVSKQSLTKDINIINRVNEITSTILSDLGINMNFAPVVDIDYGVSSVCNKRCYGTNKNDVIKYALPIIDTFRDKNIISVMKHFPGHGLVKGDSHFVIPKINDTYKLEDDLSIYEEAIKNGMDAVMIGHLKVKGYGNKPASINKEIIDKYLINRYNYKGLIITDDLRMNVLKNIYGLKNVIINSIKSGANILMIKYKKGDLINLYSKLDKIIDSHILDEYIDNSYNIIKDIKNKYKINNQEIINNIDINKYNNDIININKDIDNLIN